IFIPLFLGMRGLHWTTASQITFVYVIIGLIINDTIFKKWYIHDTIFRVKLPAANYQARIEKWLVTENSNIRKLGEKVFVLKPNQKYFLFYTIIYAVQDDYAIVLAPKRRLGSFMKVFE
ncbi:MAG: hypothetical protein ACYC0V_20130, partial [Armatimonadota bacterium]